jgi:hypothetical protein
VGREVATVNGTGGVAAVARTGLGFRLFRDGMRKIGWRVHSKEV